MVVGRLTSAGWGVNKCSDFYLAIGGHPVSINLALSIDLWEKSEEGFSMENYGGEYKYQNQ